MKQQFLTGTFGKQIFDNILLFNNIMQILYECKEVHFQFQDLMIKQYLNISLQLFNCEDTICVQAPQSSLYRVAQKEWNSQFFSTFLWSTVIFFHLAE